MFLDIRTADCFYPAVILSPGEFSVVLLSLFIIDLISLRSLFSFNNYFALIEWMAVLPRLFLFDPLTIKRLVLAVLNRFCF